MDLPTQKIDQAVAELHRSPWKLVLACTGAGAGLQQLIWQAAGASETLLEAHFRYDRFSLQDYIGHEPAGFCSRDTALWMASRSYTRARELCIRAGSKDAKILGLGLTAAVASQKPKRGEHRVFIACRTSDGFWTMPLVFVKGAYSREEEGRTTDLAALNTLLSLTTGNPLDLGDLIVTPTKVLGFESLDTDLFEKPLFWPDGKRGTLTDVNLDECLIFPGSFNPLHFGHEEMAKQVERMTGRRVIFAITDSHPDKGRLSTNELLRRAEQFRWSWPALFTHADALYIDKARNAPGAHFLIGADAALGILNPTYYGSDEACAATLEEMTKLGVKFYVVGRRVADKFITVDDLPVPQNFSSLFVPVSGRWDVQSRDLR